MSRTKKTALGGLLTAFSSVVILLSGIIPFGSYAFPAAAGIVVYILAAVAGNSYAWSSYIAVSVVSFILCTDKEAVLCFIFLFGGYPLIKMYIEKIKIKVASFILKTAVFNISVFVIYILMLYVFLIPEEEIEIFGINLPLLFLIALNIGFILYDYMLKLFTTAYIPIIKEKINKIFK